MRQLHGLAHSCVRKICLRWCAAWHLAVRCSGRAQLCIGAPRRAARRARRAREPRAGPALQASTFCLVVPPKWAAPAPTGTAGRVPGPVRRRAGHHADRDAVLCDVRVLQGPPRSARPCAGALHVSPSTFRRMQSLTVLRMQSRAMGLGLMWSGVPMEVGAWKLAPASAVHLVTGCLGGLGGLGGSLGAPQAAKQTASEGGRAVAVPGPSAPARGCPRGARRARPRRASPAMRADGDACGGRCPHPISLARRR